MNVWGCRSWLSPWKNEDGEYQFYGRFNAGVVSLSLLDVALSSGKNEEKFWNVLNERLELVKEALDLRVELLKNTTTHTSPIHWEYGAIARLGKGEKIEPLLKNGRTSLSLGYVGLYECVKYMKEVSHTTKDGEKFALKVMKKLKSTTEEWKKDTGYGYGVYGSPAEALTAKFARTSRARFGVIEGVTDRDYLTNSYHVHVTEEIDALEKLKFEAQFQVISSGGCISYIEVPNMFKNLEALYEVVKFMYENIQYAEINTKSDYCQVCNFDGEIKINEDVEWECPNCGNKDTTRMNVVRRTCGYLGENFWSHGRTCEISDRYCHLK